MAIQHTPTPWKCDNKATKRSNFGDFKCTVSHKNSGEGFPSGLPFYETVAVALGGVRDEGEVAEANAAYIVRCVNSHEELVRSLQYALEHYVPEDDKQFIAQEMRKTLAKSEGK